MLCNDPPGATKPAGYPVVVGGAAAFAVSAARQQQVDLNRALFRRFA